MISESAILGWWLLPAILTMACLLWARNENKKDDRSLFHVSAINYALMIVPIVLIWVCYSVLSIIL